MKGLLFDKEDLQSFRKIKTDIEEMLGFKIPNSPTKNDHGRKVAHSVNKSSRSISPRNPDTPNKPGNDSNLSTPNKHHQQSMAFGKTIKARKSSDHQLQHQLSAISVMRSISQQPTVVRNRSFTPSFQITKPVKHSEPHKPNVWERVTSPAKSKKSAKNPFELLDKKLDNLKKRVEELRESPEINKKSKEFYGIIGQQKLNSSIYKAYHENKLKKLKFEKELKEMKPQ